MNNKNILILNVLKIKNINTKNNIFFLPKNFLFSNNFKKNISIFITKKDLYFFEKKNFFFLEKFTKLLNSLKNKDLILLENNNNSLISIVRKKNIFFYRHYKYGGNDDDNSFYSSNFWKSFNYLFILWFVIGLNIGILFIFINYIMKK